MLIINVKEMGSIDRALKVLKTKFNKTGALAELRNRKEFKKKSEIRRDQIIKAKYLQTLKNED